MAFRPSSFGFTTQQAERVLMWFLSGVIVGIALTVAVTVLAVVMSVRVNL